LTNLGAAAAPDAVGTGIFGFGSPGGDGCWGILGRVGPSSGFGSAGPCASRTRSSGRITGDTIGDAATDPDETGMGIFGGVGPGMTGVGCGFRSGILGCMSFGAAPAPGTTPRGTSSLGVCLSPRFRRGKVMDPLYCPFSSSWT
jgi:hypothetical protein